MMDSRCICEMLKPGQGGEEMSEAKIRKILEKQLQLLSEYSEKGCPDELPNLTDSMVRLVTLLREFGSNRT